MIHLMFYYILCSFTSTFIMLLHNNITFCCGFFSLLLIQFETKCIYNFFLLLLFNQTLFFPQIENTKQNCSFTISSELVNVKRTLVYY